jgi:cobyrinic acid a,c-diamide synthase
LKGLIVAAPASGSGKTLVTLGLLRHLAKAGRKVISAKVGPDYIDPAFHAHASGRACVNLDGWAMRAATFSGLLGALHGDGEIAVCEGVMGLFDGARVAPGKPSGSTADVARATGWPVLLVIDAQAQAASAAAVVRGFASHETGISIAGVVFNRIGSEAHRAILMDAMAAALPEIPVLGCLPRGAALQLPSRHLGLVQALEHPDLEAFVEGAAALVGEHLDMARLVELMRPIAGAHATEAEPALPPLGQRIAVARDAAFAFAYPHLLKSWHDAGAEIVAFSPLADEAPDTGTDAIYLPGGYPELHAGRLAANSGFLGGLRNAAAKGTPIFGECGGYMVLGRALIDADGEAHAMAGLLGVETSFAEPKLTLGYRQARALAAGPLGDAGIDFRGHEFHYARVTAAETGEALFAIADAAGRDLGRAGLVAGSVAGSFIHLIDRA